MTGVPVHFWNEKTFTEIANALGQKLSVDEKKSRIQVSIDADKPLQFEQRIGFPSGDIGKVTLTYDGLQRYCFTCNLISHDENTCPLLAPEERELKRKLRLENLENNERSRFPIQGSQGFTSRNPLKRARSPTNGRHPSPSATSRYSELNREEKRRRSASSSYQPREARVTDTHARDRKSSSRQENHYTQHGREVWSRLENPSRRKELQGSQRGRTPNHSERNTSRKETSRQSHKPSAEWQPRRFSGEHRNKTSNHLGRTNVWKDLELLLTLKRLSRTTVYPWNQEKYLKPIDRKLMLQWQRRKGPDASKAKPLPPDHLRQSTRLPGPWSVRTKESF